MVKTASTMLDLGTKAPDFALPDTEGKIVSLSDFRGCHALLVMFLCNHCPFVKHIRGALASVTRDLIGRGVAVVGINSNDVELQPDDRPERMVEEKRESGYEFPYLFDETQKVAKAYRAACTPDFFLFDADLELVYRGQFDGSRPGNQITPTGSDLLAAVDAVLRHRPAIADQKPSIGCNIKWRTGNEPDYFRSPQTV